MIQTSLPTTRRQMVAGAAARSAFGPASRPPGPAADSFRLRPARVEAPAADRIDSRRRAQRTPSNSAAGSDLMHSASKVMSERS